MIFVSFFFCVDKIDKQAWGYIRTSGANDYLTIQEIIVQIVTSVRLLFFHSSVLLDICFFFLMFSTGGNVLINIGPTAYGKIIPVFEERLRQMGSWLKVNGEAIYGSVPWKYQNDTINSNVW
jgi:alpha-L-fucosidase